MSPLKKYVVNLDQHKSSASIDEVSLAGILSRTLHCDGSTAEMNRFASAVQGHKQQLETLLGREVSMEMAALDFTQQNQNNPLELKVIATEFFDNLLHSACYDSLTLVYNRFIFEVFLKQRWYEHMRYKKVFGLVLCDIDYFKKFNDQFGHQTGDNVLRHIGTVLRKNSRENDVVCRYGGEEFAILVDRASEKTTQDICERIQSDLALLHNQYPEEIPTHVSMSYGFCLSSQVKSEQDLLAGADEALYIGKHKGRNQIQRFLNGQKQVA